MRLLNTTTICLKLFNDDEQIPNYAILSHRWISPSEEEVQFRDIGAASAVGKKGFPKVRKACERAKHDDLSWIWIDTCCIDKSSSAELSEAINSMFAYYQRADRCYAYLVDVDSSPNDMDITFERSEWFGRAWTLQELLAPEDVLFFDKGWNCFGTKSSMANDLSKITGIPEMSLYGQFEPSTFSIAERMSWASKRKATRREDLAYGLLGIFDINMPMVYGEGSKAFQRLQEEIIKRSDDQSIFAWETATEDTFEGRVLAMSPAEFASCKGMVPVPGNVPFSLNNIGLQIEVVLISSGFGQPDTHVARLNCVNQESEWVGIVVKALHEKTFARVPFR